MKASDRIFRKIDKGNGEKNLAYQEGAIRRIGDLYATNRSNSQSKSLIISFVVIY